MEGLMYFLVKQGNIRRAEYYPCDELDAQDRKSLSDTTKTSEEVYNIIRQNKANPVKSNSQDDTSSRRTKNLTGRCNKRPKSKQSARTKSNSEPDSQSDII